MTVAQALHRNHEAFWRHMARVSGGTAEEIPGGLLVTTGITMTPYNQVHWRTTPHEPEILDRAAAHFVKHDLPWRIVCERPSPIAHQFAGTRGQPQEPLYPILSRSAENSRSSVPPTDLTITTASNAADMRAFTDCAGASFQHDPSLLEALVNDRVVDDPRFRCYLGLHGDRCVAISVGVRESDTVGVYFVGVRPEFRSRGHGATLTDKALSGGYLAGATTAVLQATPAGYALYRRMGFKHIGEYHIWDLPTTAESGSHVG